MQLSEMILKIQQHRPKPLGVERHYAVLLPLIMVGGEVHLLFEVRSINLGTQPGEISFPGGQIETGETPATAAVRETVEELMLAENQVELVGELDYMISPYNLIIYAYTGIIHAKLDEIYPNKSEVDEIFTVPLHFFSQTQPEIYQSEIQIRLEENFPFHLIPQGTAYRWRKGRYPVYFYQYDQRVIWGITARLTASLMSIISGNQTDC